MIVWAYDEFQVANYKFPEAVDIWPENAAKFAEAVPKWNPCLLALHDKEESENCQ